MTDVTIRDREPTDVPRCVEALAEVHEADRYPIVWPADPVGWLSPSNLLQGWIAERSDSVVGHVVLAAGSNAPDGLQPDGRPLAVVKRLFVTPSARRQGIGEQLLARGQAWAVRSGLSLILDVAELGRSAAIALYERAGWRHTASATADWTTPEGSSVTMRYYRPPHA